MNRATRLAITGVTKMWRILEILVDDSVKIIWILYKNTCCAHSAECRLNPAEQTASMHHIKIDTSIRIDLSSL